jgi:hypothetical protein
MYLGQSAQENDPGKKYGKVYQVNLIIRITAIITDRLTKNPERNHPLRNKSKYLSAFGRG